MLSNTFKKRAIALLAGAVAATGFAGLALNHAERTALADVLPGTAGLAQIHVDIGGPSPAPPLQPQPAPMVIQERLSDQQLDRLLEPIALYPDPLVAVMLPGATYPDEIAAAADWVRHHPEDFDAINEQNWDTSINALAHTPSVLDWMNENQDWTNTLGIAFEYQTQSVMDSIQRLRNMALAVGSLQSTPQQRIVIVDNRICIEPTMDVVEVPVYDWRNVYIRREEPTFFVGARIGGWFDHDLDWERHSVVVGARWDRGWDHRWDDDRNARRITYRDAREGERGRESEARFGGQPWHRDDARPAPKLPEHTREVIKSGRPESLAPAKPPARRDVKEQRHENPTPRADERRPDNPTHDARSNTTPPTGAPAAGSPSTPPTSTPPANRDGEHRTSVSTPPTDRPPDRATPTANPPSTPGVEHNPTATTPPNDRAGEHTTPTRTPSGSGDHSGDRNPSAATPANRGSGEHITPTRAPSSDGIDHNPPTATPPTDRGHESNPPSITPPSDRGNSGNPPARGLSEDRGHAGSPPARGRSDDTGDHGSATTSPSDRGNEGHRVD